MKLESYKIKIAGLNGYLGQAIYAQLIKKGHLVSGIERKLLYGSVEELKTHIQGSDVIINLAGESIFQRWNSANKESIYNSRIVTTRNLVSAINRLVPDLRPSKFINASAIGIYKTGILHDEASTQYDDGFLGMVVKDWENELKALPETVQSIVFRLGIVIGKNSKLIKNQVLPFKLGFGAKIGNGKQMFPYIHEKDVANAFTWAIEELKEGNLFNLVTPESISNTTFTKIFAKTLKRKAFFSIPSFLIKLVMGEAAVMLLKSPEVKPNGLTEMNFRFQYPNLESALKEIFE